MRSIAHIVLSTSLLLSTCIAQTGSVAPGSIRGEVVTKTENGEVSVFPHARILLHGAVNKEAESDAQGAFEIAGLPPGTYSIVATAPGLNASVAEEVKSGTSSVMVIELNVVSVTSAVTVNASESLLNEESAQKNTISQSVVEHAPNRDEKIESLLPLVPGVVRGPDGRINMKGAQATQA